MIVRAEQGQHGAIESFFGASKAEDVFRSKPRIGCGDDAAQSGRTPGLGIFAFHAVIRPATPTGSKVTVVLPQLRVSGSSWSAFRRPETR